MPSVQRAVLVLEDDDVVALGDVLRTTGYAVETNLLTDGPGAEGAVLRRLFSLGAAVPRSRAEEVLTAALVEALLAAALLEEADGERVRSPLRITPLEDQLFLHDRPDPHGPADVVASVGPASVTLANLMVRRPVERALDIGTGCGVQALIAARFCEQVVATDVTERALAMATVNARLNGATNVELRSGNLFEPVEGESFDLIVGNPPFVISPETSHVYRDSGLGGDELSRTVVEGAAAHLVPGGHATVLCEWILRAGEAWADVPRRWTADSGCDALVLHYRTSDPEAYAAGWNAPLRQLEPDAYADALERWSAYQRGLGAAAVSTGAIVLRRPVRGGGWFRGEEMPAGPQGIASDHLLATFTGQDRLQDAGAGDLLDAVLEPVEGKVLTQQLLRRDGAWATPDVHVATAPGAGTGAQISPALVHVLLKLDGKRPLREIVDEAAGDLGADPDALRDEAAALAERLLGLGLCRTRTVERQL